MIYACLRFMLFGPFCVLWWPFKPFGRPALTKWLMAGKGPGMALSKRNLRKRHSRNLRPESWSPQKKRQNGQEVPEEIHDIGLQIANI